MALQKQAIPINFSKGLNTKVDPKQLPIGSFLTLVNSVFTNEGLLQKRYGFLQLPTLTIPANYVTTFNGNLTAIGTTIQALSTASLSWVSKGALHPVSLTTLPLIRSNTNQVQCDSVIAPNGLICTVYTDQIAAGNLSYKYAIADSVTGQNIVAPTVISATASAVYGTPKVYLLGNYFVILYTDYPASTYELTYLAINTQTLNVVIAGSPLSSLYTPLSGVSFDAVVNTNNNQMYVAYNGSDIGGAVRLFFLTSQLVASAETVIANEMCAVVSCSIDYTNNNFYIAYYNSTLSDVRIIVRSQTLASIVAASPVASISSVLNITSITNNKVCTIYYEITNNYGYSPANPTNLIRWSTVSGLPFITVSNKGVFLRSVGLASKAFYYNTVIYFLVAYDSAYQSTYFLVNSAGNIISRFAYSNAGGYCNFGLPNYSISGSVVSIPYLLADLVQATNKSNLAASSSPVYSQYGINLITFDLNPSTVCTAEIGSELNISGGFVWGYDGYSPVEQGFFLWPDNVGVSGVSTAGSLPNGQVFYQATYEWADNQGNVFRSAPSVPVSYTILDPSGASTTFTGNRTSGSPTLTSISSFTNIQPGQPITGTGIPGSTYIVSFNTGASTLLMSNNASSGSSTSTTVTPSTLTSLLINVPTLRLTYKTANPVKIVIYRADNGTGQIYYQVTSLLSPLLNVTTQDSVSFTDTYADSAIIGNNILYTTGGVVEDVAPPATSAMTLFKSRLMVLDAEDPNLLWFSKQVIEATPVEMSDLLTLYIAPTISAQGSTGYTKCLAAMDDKLILFKKDAIYYMTGTGPDNTGANNDFSDPIFITSNVGCANQASIVFQPNGLMFQSDKGIWILDRNLSTQYIGAPVEAYNGYQVTGAIAVPGTNQVRFALSNGVTLMYDHYYDQWGTFSNVAGVSATLYEGLHTFINSNGTVFQENIGSYTDGSSPVLMAWQTGWINLAGLQGFQRLYYFYLLGTYITPHKLSIGVAYDYASSPSQYINIVPINYNGPLGSTSPLGSGSPLGGTPALEQWRVNVETQKCQAFQLSMNESFDPFFQTVPGPGLTLSGINSVVGLKKGYHPQPALTITG